MENSETRQKVINLGKSLIAEFDELDSTDTLTKWLIHYVAEQLVLVSNSKGQEKNEVEKRCVDTILKIWSNRNTLPDGMRPFENFEPIMRGLERLDDHSPRRYYNEYNQFGHDLDSEENSETKKWVNNAIKIDDGARTLVSEFFKIAAEHAKDEKTREILGSVNDLPGNDIQFIVKLYRGAEKETSEEDILEKKRNELVRKLDRINNMIEACNQYAEVIQKELKIIGK